MKECSLNSFLEEINPWLESKYIRMAETDAIDRFTIHFYDGTKHNYLISDCEKEQIESIFEKLKSKGIKMQKN